MCSEIKALMKQIKSGNLSLKDVSKDHLTNKNLVLAAIDNDPLSLKYASEELKKDKEVVLNAIIKDGTAINYAADELKKDTGFVLAFLIQSNFSREIRENIENHINEDFKIKDPKYKFLPKKFKKDKFFAFCDLVALSGRYDGGIFESIRNISYYDKSLTEDKEFIKTLIQFSGGSILEFVSKKFQNDKELNVLALVKDGGNNLINFYTLKFLIENYWTEGTYFLYKLINNISDFSQFSIEQLYHIYRSTNVDLCENFYHALHAKTTHKEFLQIVKQEEINLDSIVFSPNKEKQNILCDIFKDNSILFDLSNDYHKDKEIILNAVLHDDVALKYASDELKNDREIVLKSVIENSDSLEFASDKLKNDKEIVLKAVMEHGLSLEFASNELKNDREIVLKAVMENSDSLEFASDELKNDREIVLKAIMENKAVIENYDPLNFASDKLKNDREIVLKAVMKDGLSLKYASDDLKNDKEIVLKAVIEDGDSLEFASDRLKNDREIVLKAVMEHSKSLEFASDELQKYSEFYVGLKNEFNSLDIMDDEWINNKILVKNKLQNSWLSFNEIPSIYKNDKEILYLNFINRSEIKDLLTWIDTTNDFVLVLNIIDKKLDALLSEIKDLAKSSRDSVWSFLSMLEMFNRILKTKHQAELLYKIVKNYLKLCHYENGLFSDYFLRQIYVTYVRWNNNKSKGAEYFAMLLSNDKSFMSQLARKNYKIINWENSLKYDVDILKTYIKNTYNYTVPDGYIKLIDVERDEYGYPIVSAGDGIYW